MMNVHLSVFVVRSGERLSNKDERIYANTFGTKCQISKSSH